jgi:hypothetical protein
MGKKSSGSVSRQAAFERQSASSQAWVRFQINDMKNPSKLAVATLLFVKSNRSGVFNFT